MGWDSSRPVPWQRLMREWVIYIAIMALLLIVFFRDSGLVGALAGLLVSGPLYLLFGYVLAKFGYQRKSLKEMRSERADRPTGSTRSTKGSKAIAGSDGEPVRTTRERPPATSRTSTGINRPRAKRRRR